MAAQPACPHNCSGHGACRGGACRCPPGVELTLTLALTPNPNPNQVQYFKMLDNPSLVEHPPLEIPESAAALNEKNETFRVQMGNLELIVGR